MSKNMWEDPPADKIDECETATESSFSVKSNVDAGNGTKGSEQLLKILFTGILW